MKIRSLILSLLLVFVVAMSCTACGGGNDDGGDNPPVTYNITWIDEAGATIGTTEVDENKTPGKHYTVTDTEEWDYTFEGWSTTQGGEVLTEIPAATADATYYAVVSKTKRVYTVTFVTNGGSAVSSQSVEYGSLATLPEEPTYDGFRFVGWCTDDTLTTAVNWDKAITGNTNYYASWNEMIDIGALLEALLSGYELNPYSYLPEAMLPSYSENLISKNDANKDYSSFVNVSDIPSHGFGQQWNMILDNINQSMNFFNVLSVIEALSAASITAFNNYIDENPGDTASYEFENGIYNISIDFDGEIISYAVDYTATVPVFGEQTIQLALAMNVETGEKAVRIQLGDANALKYVIKENYYEFAIKYLGVRRAFFSIERDDNGDVSGHIYEFLVYEENEIKSVADFYITDDYVSAVGNKADGMLGFTGYISELYNAESGKLIGYEVQETLSAITYNTIWLDLDVFDGIDSIKYTPAVGETPAKFFINGKTNAWETMKVGGFGLKMMSRRYDIEFRTQYFYYYDSETETYKEVKAEIPMLFIQQENYETFESDVYSNNNVRIDLTISNAELGKIISDYETLIEIFITNKDSVTSQAVVDFIGGAVTQ